MRWLNKIDLICLLIECYFIIRPNAKTIQMKCNINLLHLYIFDLFLINKKRKSSKIYKNNIIVVKKQTCQRVKKKFNKNSTNSVCNELVLILLVIRFCHVININFENYLSSKSIDLRHFIIIQAVVCLVYVFVLGEE